MPIIIFIGNPTGISREILGGGIFPCRIFLLCITCRSLSVYTVVISFQHLFNWHVSLSLQCVDLPFLLLQKVSLPGSRSLLLDHGCLVIHSFLHLLVIVRVTLLVLEYAIQFPGGADDVAHLIIGRLHCTLVKRYPPLRVGMAMPH